MNYLYVKNKRGSTLQNFSSSKKEENQRKKNEH